MNQRGESDAERLRLNISVHAALTALRIFLVKSTMLTMRRAPAVLLIGLFSLWLISPALIASSEESNLPACCRRDGRHHCAMDTVRSDSSGPAMQGTRCSFFPVAQAVCTNPIVSLLAGISLVTLDNLASQPACHSQIESLYRSSFNRSDQKRGPPTLNS